MLHVSFSKVPPHHAVDFPSSFTTDGFHEQSQVHYTVIEVFPKSVGRNNIIYYREKYKREDVLATRNSMWMVGDFYLRFSLEMIVTLQRWKVRDDRINGL